MNINELEKSANRPGQYIAFSVVPVRTKEGAAFVYFAVDDFSEFAFHLGAEKKDDEATLIACVERLMNNPDFIRHRGKGFTLIFDKYRELSRQISCVIVPYGGTIMFDDYLNHKISLPVLQSMADFFSGKKR